MVKRGRLWRGTCRCGERDARSWTYKPNAPTCTACGRVLALKLGPVVRFSLPHSSRPARHSQKGFTPHYNESFGCKVESVQHLHHLQEKHGCEDADPRDKDNVPRDLDTIAANAERDRAYAAELLQ